MPRSLRKEIDALMRAQTEQMEHWHEAMARPDDAMTLVEAMNIAIGMQGIHRDAILRLADEIDRLRGTEEPES